MTIYHLQMIRRMAVILCLMGLVGKSDGEQEIPLPNLGTVWFERLKAPESRQRAFYELMKSEANSGKHVGIFAEFSKQNPKIRVFPCPQPDYPDAWAILSKGDYHLPHNENYPLHPLENTRRKEWHDAIQAPGTMFPTWRDGQPWLESIAGVIVNASGEQLGEYFFFSEGAIADFDGDGMLDVFQVEQCSMKNDLSVDLVSIGPLSASAPYKGLIGCNQHTDSRERKWHYSLRTIQDKGMQIVLVPLEDGRDEIVMGFRNGKFESLSGPLPENVWVQDSPAGHGWDSITAFFKSKGLELSGIGSDPAVEIQSERPKRLRKHGDEPLSIKLPPVTGLAPRQAARKSVESCFDPYYQRYFELASIGEALPIPTSGWVSRFYYGGWSPDVTTVWWLKDGKVECWTHKETAEFHASPIPRGDFASGISVLHELDLLRSVPKEPCAPADPHDIGAGDDIPTTTIIARSLSESSHITIFPTVKEGLLMHIGSVYNRQLAAYLADSWVSNFPRGSDEKSYSLYELASVWLNPEHTKETPWPLTSALIRSIGDMRLVTLEPHLRSLLQSLPPPDVDELRWRDLRKTAYASSTDYETSQKQQLEIRELELRMGQNHVHALRKAGDEALRKLEAPTEIEASEKLREALSKTQEIFVHEGLPHPQEAALLAKEEARTDVERIAGLSFYSPASPAKDTEPFKALLVEAARLKPYSGTKRCGSFHPDFAIRWDVEGKPCHALLCFSCGEVIFHHDDFSLRYDLAEIEPARKALEIYTVKRPRK